MPPQLRFVKRILDAATGRIVDETEPTDAIHIAADFTAGTGANLDLLTYTVNTGNLLRVYELSVVSKGGGADIQILVGGSVKKVYHLASAGQVNVVSTPKAPILVINNLMGTASVDLVVRILSSSATQSYAAHISALPR